MKLLIAAALLLLVAGCGSSPAAGPSKADRQASASAAASKSAEAALNVACNKLGRTWAVQAEKLVSTLYLALPVDNITAAMTAATEQMDIEGCKGEMVSDALKANSYAAEASLKLLMCANPDEYACGKVAGDLWKKKGFPPLLAVRSLAG